MGGYKYVQTEENGKWLLIKDDNKFYEKTREMGAVRATILSVSDDLDAEDTDPNKVKYIGPLYFDIDVDRSNLALAISSTQELVGKLMDLDVRDSGVEIYCSGSKGFHVIVPHSQFLESNRMIGHLPYIYMEVARDLYVYGLDFSVYSGGKGRMWRPVNGLRPDGKYRVRITLEELKSLTPKAYLQMVSAPRNLAAPGLNGHKANALSIVFDRARARTRKGQANKKTALTVDQLIPFAEEPPGCIDKLIKGEILRGVNFNLAGLQLASFIARAGVPDYKAKSLIAIMSQNTESNTYNTVNKRDTHLQGLTNYAKAKPSVFFSCATMRAYVEKPPCKDCQLQQDQIADTPEEQQYIAKRPDGYYVMAERSDRKVTTFVFDPQEVYLEHQSGEYTARRTGTVVDLYSNHERIAHNLYFEEVGWRSKGEFLKQLEGLAGVDFLGADTDVQKIKISVYNDLEGDGVEEITNISAAGIHESSIGKNKVYTYVEPGLSINSYGIQGTHRLKGGVAPLPIMRKARKIKKGDEVLRQVLRRLMSVNRPEVSAQLIGWHSLCHLKAHITSKYRQFPSLNLWGTAGSGKSTTSQLMALLNGVDYLTSGSPLASGLTTMHPVIEVVTSTTTIPRIIEEFNRSQVKKFGVYEAITECIKASWENLSVPRGAIGRSKEKGSSNTNSHVVNKRVTAPLIVCSEEPPIKGSLRQRMVQVQLTNLGKEGREEFYFNSVADKEIILSFSKSLTMMALKTKTEWIVDRFNLSIKYIPKEIIDRPRYSYAMLLVGLDYFHAVAHSLSISLDEEVAELKQALVGYLNKDSHLIAVAKKWSTVDQVLHAVGEMTQLSIQTSNLSPLIQGKHWISKEEHDSLIIDMRLVFSLYKRYARSIGLDDVFESLQQLAPLLKSEEYYLTDQRIVPEMAGRRKLWVLSLSKMKERGHEIEMFK